MVVFFDIDGTIVDDESQIIPESTVQAVRTLTERGHLAVINTGRPYSHIDPRVRAMDFSGFVCGCGMEIMLRGQWLHRVAPDRALCDRVIRAVRECGMAVLYEQEGAIATDGALSQLPPDAREVKRLVAKGLQHREISGLDSFPFIKFLTRDLPGCRREEFLARMEPYFTCIDRGNSMVEYVLKGCSKAGGIHMVLRTTGCPQEQCLAIGDSTNDLPMFQAAGHTVCMGNGMAELKEKAEYITAGVMEGGIAQALAHYGLI